MLLVVFALIVFGPKRLPDIGRQVGRAIAEVRKVSREFEREVRDAAEPFEREVREAERTAKSTYSMDPHHSKFLSEPKDVKASEPTEDTSANGEPSKNPD